MASGFGAATRHAGRTWLVLLSFAAAAAAQNRIVLNPDFDADDTIDFCMGTTLTWIADDDADSCHLGPGASGSVRAIAIPDGAGPGVSLAAATAGDCLSVQEGQVIKTEVAFLTDFEVAAAPIYFPQPGCAGTQDGANISESSPGSLDWSVHRQSFTVPANRPSMRVAFVAFDTNENSEFEVRFDRAYAGADERIFADDYEANALCRWSTHVGQETTPPTTPGPMTSETHDGGPAPPPLTVTWGASTDEGGSGLRTYLAGYLNELAKVPCSAITSEVGLVTTVSTPDEFPSGTYYIYACAEDNAGNQSGVVVGGPYVVQ